MSTVPCHEHSLRCCYKDHTILSLFPFHHNGITLSAGKIEGEGDSAVVVAPRLLNSAQTISTFADFWERNGPALKASGGDLQVDRPLVSCRIITGGTTDEITEITISNNC